MDVVITGTATLALLALALYGATLAIATWRATSLAHAGAALERSLLAERIAQLAAKRLFEQQRSELSWNGFRKFQVHEKVPEGGGICSFYLKPHDGKQLPQFRPGQYLTFRLNVPGQAKQVIRCYSLSDGPRADYFRVSIKRCGPPPSKLDAPPGVSSCYFHDLLNPGDILDVKAPSGHFYLDTSKPRPVVLIGGGVGLTPVMSMLNTIAETAWKQEVWFFYGLRNGKEHIMREHFARMQRELPHLKLHICYSDPTPECKPGVDYQHAERVSVDLFKRLLPSNNFDFYICGPPPMMDSLVAGLQGWGVPEDRIHFEAFGPASVKKVSKPDAPEAASAAASGINVVFAKSGKTIAWSGAASLLDFAESNGVNIDFGCRAGNCGTCLTAIKVGEVAYPTPPGQMPEAGSCLVCISVPRTALTIDA